MVEVEELDAYLPAPRRERLGWLLSIWYAPRRTLTAITRQERAVWLLPLLVISVLALAAVFAAGPLRQAAAAATPQEPPESFQWMTPEQQQQYLDAQASAYGPVQVYVFPAIGALAGAWLRWFLLGAVLHLALTTLGSSHATTITTAYNITAWASLPLALRHLVQIIAMLGGKALINNPGLSGFLAPDGTGWLLFARLLLGAVDLYLIWQIVLMWVGVRTTGMARGKALTAVLVAVLLLVIISALLQFLAAQLAGLDVQSQFMFF